MHFGVVLQTNPPAWRTVQLAELSRGARVRLRVDVRLPPAVAGAVRDLQPDPQTGPRRITVGPMVTNPATRDWTVTASVFATLNEMYGNRTVCGIGRGDSAVRVTNGKPSTVRQGGPGGDPRHPRTGQLPGRGLSRAPPCSSPGPGPRRLEVWVAAYGPLALKTAGEVGDGFILQLADVDIAAWMIDRRSRTAASNRPAATPTPSPSASPPPTTCWTTGPRTGSTCGTSAGGSGAWSATTWPTSWPSTATPTRAGRVPSRRS